MFLGNLGFQLNEAAARAAEKGRPPVPLCPVASCTNQLPDPDPFGTCPSCWQRVPVSLRPRVYRAWEVRRQKPQDQQAIDEHEAAKRAAVQAIRELR